MNIIYFFSMFTIFFGFSFLFFTKKRATTIWYGFTFLLFVFNLLVVMFGFLVQKNFKITLYVLAILFVGILLLMPFFILFLFFDNGIKLIKKEGFKPTNLLSLVAAIGLLLYEIFWPIIADVNQSHLLNTVYQWVSFIVFYFSFVFILFTVTNLLNLIHFKKEEIDYYIVLGAGLIGDQVTPLLASRINKAVDLQAQQKYGKIIFSGGQGLDEDLPEGEAMHRYALKEGIEPSILLKETKSKTTFENIKFSKKIIDQDWQKNTQPKLAVVTNNYHVLRGLMKAQELNIPAIGYGAKSKLYFSLNAFFREYVAYLEMTYHYHRIIIGLVTILLFGLYFILELYG